MGTTISARSYYNNGRARKKNILTCHIWRHANISMTNVCS